MRRLLGIVATAVLCGIGSASAPAVEMSQKNLEQVAIDLGHRYDTTYGTRDAAAMAMVYADDGVLISPPGPIVRGRDALKAYYTKRFAAGARDHKITVLDVHPMGDGGYGINHFSVTVQQANGRSREEQGTIVTIYRHEPDGWHMALVAPSVPETAHAK